MAAPYGSTSYAGAQPASQHVPQQIYSSPPAAKKPRQNGSSEFVAALATLLIPWAVFSLNWGALAFTLRYRHAQLAWFIVELGFCLVCVEAYFATRAWRKRRTRDPTWLILLCASTAVGWVLGATFGLVNYERHLRHFYDMESLEMYVNIDPAMDNGQRYLDAGRIVFTRAAQVNGSLAAGVEDHGMRCVAPVTSASGNIAFYDFWVVGTDCCMPDGKDFHCADLAAGAPPAHSAMRVMDASALPAYRRAVAKASALHRIHTRNPMFFTWTDDPVTSVNKHQDIGFKNFLLGTLLFFGLQLFVITLVTSGAARLK